MLQFFFIDLHTFTIHLDTSTLMWLTLATIFIGLMYGVRGPCEDIVGQFCFTIFTFSSLCIKDHIHVCWRVVYKDIYSEVLFLLSLSVAIGVLIRATMILASIELRRPREIGIYICGFAFFLVVGVSGELCVICVGILLGSVMVFSFLLSYQFSFKLAPKLHSNQYRKCFLTVVVVLFIVSLLMHLKLKTVFLEIFLALLFIFMFIFLVNLILDKLTCRPVFGTIVLDKLQEKLDFFAQSGSFSPSIKLTISIADFAGQEAYYNTHHTFMTTNNSIYVIVFDITRFLKPENRDKEYKRILFWLRSVRSHTNHEASVLLVATHIDDTNPQKVSEIQDYFQAMLAKANHSYSKMICWNNDKPFYAIDNCSRKSPDICKFKQSMWQTARSVLRDETSHPIRWLNFFAVLNDIREKAYGEKSLSGLMTLQDVKKSLEQKCVDQEDLEEMLEYFNTIGEIFYDKNDPFLSQYVVLDRELLVNFAEKLTTIPEKSARGPLTPLWERVAERGLLHQNLANHLFHCHDHETTADDFVKVVLAILEQKGLICKCSGAGLPEDESDGDQQPNYIVPSMLPPGYPEVPDEEDIVKYYFDFGEFLPDALFTRLLARCQTQSDLQAETDEQHYLYREGGEFNLEASVGRFYYWLRLHTNHATQNLIEVSVKAYCGSNPFNLLKHLWQLVEDLRKEQFSGIRFHCGAECRFSRPHQDTSRDKPLHILNEAHDNQPEFLEVRKHFTCGRREVTMNEYRQVNTLA